jgi:hypothetical protein
MATGSIIGEGKGSEACGAETQPGAKKSDGRFSANRQFTIALTLAAYCGTVLVGITHHEPWADEAHAWLLSRDLGYRYLVFHQLAYEGHPPLWATILWVASHWCHLPYQSMNWIGCLCAIAGCGFFCRYSPFPLWIRVLFPFTYFMAFQYAVVARPYVLLPLCTFAAAHFFAEADRRPWRFVAATSALALLCAPGTMIALGLMAARIWYTFRAWHDISLHGRRKLFCGLILFEIVMALVAVVNWPPGDRMNARFDRPATAGRDTGNYGVAALPFEIAVGFFGSTIPSIAFLAVVGAWCACRRCFLPFALPMAALLGFFIKVYGSLWHCGALTLIAVAALWIAWRSPERCAPRLQRALQALLLVGLAGLFALHIYWSARTFAMDYSRPYSGSLDAANFLRSVGADARTTCGIGFFTSAVQPYFRESIYQNWPKGEGFWRNERTNHADQDCNGARWIVIARCCTFDKAKQGFPRWDRFLRSSGYAPAHVSEGTMFFEGREVEPTDFVVYERVR